MSQMVTVNLTQFLVFLDVCFESSGVDNDIIFYPDSSIVNHKWMPGGGCYLLLPCQRARTFMSVIKLLMHWVSK